MISGLCAHEETFIVVDEPVCMCVCPIKRATLAHAFTLRVPHATAGAAAAAASARTRSDQQE